MVVETSQGSAELPRHLKLQVQPCLKLAGPVKRAWGEIFGLDGDEKLLKDPGKGDVTMGLVLDCEGQVVEVAEGARSVSLLLVFARPLIVRNAGRGRSRDGLYDGDLGNQKLGMARSF